MMSMRLLRIARRGGAARNRHRRAVGPTVAAHPADCPIASDTQMRAASAIFAPSASKGA